MSTFLTELHDTLIPDRAGPFGPLPPLMVAMTVVTGLVDAFSYLVLGHVFVANMTGNVVFLGFAVAGASGFSIPASLLALAAFGAGSVLGGRIATTHGARRDHHLAVASAVQSVLLAVAVIMAAACADPPQPTLRYLLIVALATAMGVQNSTVRRLAVPDLTTTVLTLTITGMGADSALGGGKGSKSGRRLIAVIAMFIGALVGAALVLHTRIFIPLAIALALVVNLAWVVRAAGRSGPAWTLVG